MENLITQMVKFLSSTVVVHIYSFPNFSIETFLAFIVCVVHVLLIHEVNSLYRRTNAKAAAKLRLRHASIKELEACSYHSMARVQTSMFPEKVETTTTHRHSFIVPSAPYRRLNRKMSNTSHFGWVISRKTSSVYGGNFSDRIEQLLAVSPSEYVRKEKERKYKEAGLKNCIQSLTSLLEKALEAEGNGLTMDQVSKDAVRNSIKTIKSNFENHLSREPLAKVASCRSIYSLISHTMTKSTLQNSLSPELNPENNGEGSKSDECMKTEEDSQDGKNSLIESLSDLLEDRLQKDIHLLEKNSPIAICDA